MLRDEFQGKKAIKALSKALGEKNLDGSPINHGRERPAAREISDEEYRARYDLAFGRINQEQFDAMKKAGEFDE